MRVYDIATDVLSEGQATAVGRRKIRNSQATAIVVGGLVVASGWLDWNRWPLGLVLGLIYSNAFEYAVHRALLHGTAGYLHKAHERHHETWGKDAEGLYVRFGPPLTVVGLFTAHALPLVLLDRLGAGLGGGAFLAFVVYYTLYEELHWRIHLGRLPRWLGWMRRHHFEHHRGEAGRYSVLVPLWDRVLEPKPQAPNPKS